MLIANAKNITKPAHANRTGSATLEFAVLAPFLMLLMLGTIDTGQFASVHHVVHNASREGARLAAKFDTETASQVEAHVMTYLAGEFPGLVDGVEVTVKNLGGAPLQDLASIPTGSQLAVEVVLQFDEVRWLSGAKLLEKRMIDATTSVRRE